MYVIMNPISSLKIKFLGYEKFKFPKNITNLQCWEKLGDSDQQKEQIEEKPELVEQKDRQECQHVMFRVSHNIFDIVSWLHPAIYVYHAGPFLDWSKHPVEESLHAGHCRWIL